MPGRIYNTAFADSRSARDNNAKKFLTTEVSTQGFARTYRTASPLYPVNVRPFHTPVFSCSPEPPVC